MEKMMMSWSWMNHGITEQEQLEELYVFLMGRWSHAGQGRHPGSVLGALWIKGRQELRADPPCASPGFGTGSSSSSSKSNNLKVTFFAVYPSQEW